jgi:hypothetical protein
MMKEVENSVCGEGSHKFTAKSFMVHFQLKKEVDNLEEPVPVSFEGFGEETYDTLCERVYSVYSKASMRVHDDLNAKGDVPKEEYDAALKVVNDALAAERMRNWDSKKPNLSDDPDVAELQKELDLPRPMAEQAVKEHRRRAIVEMPSPSDEVQ